MIVRKIESKLSRQKKRVAAYARVSTEAEEQKESFNTQVAYYTRIIQANPDWEYVDVYADPGRSGTSAEHRPGFQRMVADAKAGKIDIVLVKSISRFARNVADAQTYVHELKAANVEVRFEREAISSFEPSSDMVFSVLAAVAQEESRSISENVKWAYRKNAEKGIRHIGSNRVLGYDEIGGVLMPNSEAWIVKQIFNDYACGLPMGSLIERLTSKGVRRLRSDKPFTASSILSILKNETYTGDRMIQKKAPHNYLTKQPDPTLSYNSYFIKNSHEPIISMELWECAQSRLKAKTSDRLDGVYKRSSAHFLYGLVFCAKCGAPYKRRTFTGASGKYKVWNCSERQKGKNGNGCSNPMIREEELLKGISDSLGWEWNSEEEFDAWAFEQLVSRVEIDENCAIVLKQAA